MSLFAKPTFSAAGYAASRPTYPASLFKTVLAFHNAPSPSPSPRPKGGGTLLDLGCGHGLISREMSKAFTKVIATDPSAGMLAQAKAMTTTTTTTDDANKIEFRQAVAEDLRSVAGDGSVDMVVSGQAAHWFDYSRAWPELARVVKPGGTLAFWGYKDSILVGFPRANRVFERFCYGEGEMAPSGVPEGLAAYWEQPGRGILRRLLVEVEPPAEQWERVQRMMVEVGAETTAAQAAQAWMRRETTLGGLESYVRTASSYLGWREAHPEMKSRAEGGEGDVVDFMMEEMVASEPAWKDLGENWRDEKVTAVWGSYILMAKRRGERRVKIVNRGDVKHD